MREITFLKQNADKWKQVEAHLNGRERLHPDLLAEFFVQLTDDLSYARTFYPASNTVKYLNQLTATLHQRLYRNKKESAARLLTFFRDEFPRTLGDYRSTLLAAFAITAVAALIGWSSTLFDDTFVRLILGDTYVNMTLENIKANDPLAVYKKMHEVDMFLGITFNNIRVAFVAFAWGTLFSVGTGWILFQNGIMLGAFHAFFYKNGLLLEALRTVWIHGTLEISAIIVAGAGGLVIGNSLLFPGTFSRRQSFMRGARHGLRIVMGTVPLFVIAGFLEGFVTRHTGIPPWLNAVIILASLGLVLYYLVALPGKAVKPPTQTSMIASGAEVQRFRPGL